MPRLRPSRGSCCAFRQLTHPARHTLATDCCQGRSSRRGARPARGAPVAGARRRTRARCRGTGAPRARSAPARAADRSERAGPAREPRRSLPRGLPLRGRRLRSPHGRPSRARAGLRAMELTALAVAEWLAEDVGDGDVTTLAVIDEEATCQARILLKEAGVICGLDAAGSVFEALGARLEPLAADGDAL